MKFAVIDCYNKAYNDNEDIWECCVARTDFTIDISSADVSSNILDKLIDAGFFLDDITLEDVYFEWLESDLIVCNAVDTHEPVCRLELI